jgi:hypothetical protein
MNLVETRRQTLQGGNLRSSERRFPPLRLLFATRWLKFRVSTGLYLYQDFCKTVLGDRVFNSQYGSVKARDAINRRLYKKLIIVKTAIYRVFVIYFPQKTLHILQKSLTPHTRAVLHLGKPQHRTTSPHWLTVLPPLNPLPLTKGRGDKA